MNQTVYILILISLVVLFLFNKYEREKLQRLLQEQLLKDQAFKDSIKEKNPRDRQYQRCHPCNQQGLSIGAPTC